jgi:HD-like signal output (HDOD) protein
MFHINAILTQALFSKSRNDSVISIILIIENEREEQILKVAFEQLGVKIYVSKPSYQNYVLALQFLPDLLLVELPYVCLEQLKFAQRIRSNQRTKLVPIIGYGNNIDNMIKQGLVAYGITLYLNRPLKFTLLTKHIKQLLKPAKKTIEPQIILSSKEKDIELILHSDSLPSLKIEAMIRHVSALMAFPFTVAKVLLITHDPKTGAAQLSSAISADPVLVAHILKISNSVFFITVSGRINSVKDAIVRIGFNETRKIVMGMAVMKLFHNQNKGSGFDRIDFWYHSLLCGIIAEKVAKNIGSINSEEAFLAGLLHDLGEILLNEFLPSIFEKSLEETSRRGLPFLDCQTELMNINHCDLTSGIFPLWKMPQTITEAILFSHKHVQREDLIDTPGKKVACCILIGNILAKALHIGRECDEFIMPVSNKIFSSINLANGITPDFIEKTVQSVDTYCHFLGLEKRDYTSVFPGIENPADYSIAIYNQNNSVFVPLYIHLKQAKFKTILLPKETAVFSKGLGYNAIVVWTDQNTANNTPVEICNFVRNDTNPGIRDHSKCTPVLIAGLQEYETSKLPDSCLCINSRIDLRIFDLKLIELLTA